jgi:hypothetical protein
MLNEYSLHVSPSGSTCLVLFVYALSFPLLAVITALTLTLFLSHTNGVYGALHCDLLLRKDNIASKMELNEIIFHSGDYKEFGLGCGAM